jgi:hypothetical protein
VRYCESYTLCRIKYLVSTHYLSLIYDVMLFLVERFYFVGTATVLVVKLFCQNNLSISLFVKINLYL